MLGLIQLVSHASVIIENKEVAKIERGILALIGIEKTDSPKDAEKLLNRMINYRIFPDQSGKTNLNLTQVNGGLLLVPQFTLVAETNKGTRPGFSKGMAPQESKELFEFLVNFAKKNYAHIESGVFGAYMQVTLCNDGPITFMLRTTE